MVESWAYKPAQHAIRGIERRFIIISKQLYIGWLGNFTDKEASRKNGVRMARYAVSLPERVVRSAAALAGGLIRELGAVTVPPRSGAPRATK